MKQDLYKELARDPTKPIWNCVMQVSCRAVHQSENLMEISQIINRISELIKEFLLRYKIEHEDESNFNVNLYSY